MIVFCLSLFNVWYRIGLSLAVLVCIVLSCSAMYIVVWCCIVLYFSVFDCIVLCCIGLLCVVWNCIVLR